MSDARRPVRIGLVGLGSFGRVHARTILGLAEAQLVALVGVNQAEVDAMSRDLASSNPAGPAPQGFTDLADALRRTEAEAWIVATSTASHVEVTRAILAAGAPVLLEKPIAESLAAARSLAPLVRPDSGNLMLGHVMLFNAEVRALLAERRQRSRPKLITASRFRGVDHVARFPGESPLRLTLVHDLYVVQALMDRAEPVRFAATKSRSAGAAVACALLQWPDGASASLVSAFALPEGAPTGGADHMEVVGESWFARVATNPRPIEVWDCRARWPLGLEINDDPAAPSGMLAEELRCFCRVVRGREPVPVGAAYADALQLESWLARLEAAAASAPIQATAPNANPR
ncbi:MAG: Gfo/Idh/MocA family oxidoreductase [Planctomycetota bacterium]|nr:Gfo/Idh/MocA family oxidoreductase [Planctomycetota bacterium]